MARAIYEETMTKSADNRFIVYFLNDDDELSVNVDEVKKVNLAKILHHIKLGGSVFIASKKEPRCKISPY